MKRLIISFIIFIFAVCISAQDPIWQWIETAGGTDWDDGLGISTDADGNVFVTGGFELTADFGAFPLISNGNKDIFVAKMDTDGNWLWAESVGADLDDFGFSICTDSNNDIYVTGSFFNTISFGSIDLTSNGDKDIFVAKIDSEGNWLWAKNVGGLYYNSGLEVCIDINDNIFVTGAFQGSANFGTHNVSSSGGYDVFVAKLDLDGNWLWAKGVGGSTDDFGYSINTDETGNAYLTGAFGNSVSFGSFNLSSSGDKDIFIAKIDPDGNWLWAENAGGSGYDSGNSFSSGIDGNIYLTGQITGTANFGILNLISNGGYDIFVAKIDYEGNWIWVESTGASDHDFGNSICTDAAGNVFLTGGFADTVNFGTTTLIGHGGRDIFVSQIDPDTSNWLWAVEAGGISSDKGYSIDTDIDGDIYVTGHFVGSVHIGSFHLVSNGEYDVFVAKFSGTSSVDENMIPNGLKLSNYPNPFNPTTKINFEIRENELGILSIYNLKGQLIETQRFAPGTHRYIWDASQQSSGIYFYKLDTGSKTETKKMLLLK